MCLIYSVVRWEEMNIFFSQLVQKVASKGCIQKNIAFESYTYVPDKR